ncbi:MAG: 30S ribosomal protein S6, partial [Ruminococcaceae bacterium]|nr:30S ribosomal protein S6 [Oscillospiraceae bacterium]
MENKTNLYETLFVIDPRLSEEETKAMSDKFTGMIADAGEIVKVD